MQEEFGDTNVAVTTYAKEVYKALVVYQNFFRRLAELAQSHGVTPRFKVDVSDDATIEQLKVDELLAMPNTRHRWIENADLQNDYKAHLQFANE